MVNPIIVALDFRDLRDAVAIARELEGTVGGFKVGLQLIMGHGPTAIEDIAGLGLPVFADAKLHDIPNTVRGAAEQLFKAGARWITVHASGGAEMMEAANEGTGGDGVLAVTVLTSMDGPGLSSVGVDGRASAHVSRLAALAMDASVEGVVCSPQEAALVKSEQPDLTVFTPGVRPKGSSLDDQARVATPSFARAEGADFLVIGRPITRANDPSAAAAEIVSELNE